MNKKLNLDSIKNFGETIHQIKMPKIKSRKIFSSKTQPPTNVNSSPPPEPSSFIDRSPSKISTITSLVRRPDQHYDYPSNDYGGPSHQYNDSYDNYDTTSYNYGDSLHTTNPNNNNNNRFSNNRRLNNNYDDRFSFPPESNTVEELNEISSESGENNNQVYNNTGKEPTDPTKENMTTLSAKVAQQYKDILTDFKFKHILAKRTVISTTEIEVENYINKYDPEEEEDEEEDIDDKEIEFYDFPEGEKFDIEPADDPPDPVAETTPEKPKKIWKFKQKSVESQESIHTGSGLGKKVKRGESTESGKSASFQNLSRILPNKSNLFKIKKSSSVDLKPVPENTEVKDEQEENPKRSHKQIFDDMCGKAKKKVNTRFEKLKQKFDTKTSPDSVPQHGTQQPGNDTNNGNRNVPQRRKLGGTMKKRRDSSASEFSFGDDKQLDVIPDFYKDEENRFPQYDDIHESTTPRCLVRRDSFDENIIRTGRAAKSKQTIKETKKVLAIHRIGPPQPPKRDRSPHIQRDRSQPVMSSFNQSATPTKEIGITKEESLLKIRSEYGSDQKNINNNPPQIRKKYSQQAADISGISPEPQAAWVSNEKILSSIKNPRFTPEKQGSLTGSVDKSEWVPNKKIISSFNATPSSTPNKSSTFAERSVRGHSRTFSESDSFIPEIYENISVSEIINEENFQAWNAFPNSSSKIIKQKSVDIFNADDEKIAFDDFDDHLRNIPIIKITTQSSQNSLEPVIISPIKTKPAKFKPIVKQSSITRRLSDDITTEEHVNINNLISKFEKSSKLKSKPKPMRDEATLMANNTTTTTMNKLNSNRSQSSDKNPSTNLMIKQAKITEQVDPTTVRRIVARSSWNSSIESIESSSESESIIIQPTIRTPVQSVPPSVPQTTVMSKSKIPISVSPTTSLVLPEKSKSSMNIFNNHQQQKQQQQQEQQQHQLQQKMKKTEEWVGTIQIASSNNVTTENEIYYSMDKDDGEPVHNDSNHNVIHQVRYQNSLRRHVYTIDL